VPVSNSGEEYIKIMQNRALCGKFLKIFHGHRCGRKIFKNHRKQVEITIQIGLFAQNPIMAAVNKSE